MNIRNLSWASPLVTLPLLFGACDPDPHEQAKFPRADGGAFKNDRRISEMHFVQLDNGVSLYLKEDHQDDRVAVEVFYDAGFFNEPKGKIQVAHLAEHMGIHGATASHEMREQVDAIRFTRMSAEVAGDCVHYDYITPAEKLEQVLELEVERLKTLDFDEELLRQEAEKALGEFPSILDGAGASLSRYAFMALNQAYNYGADYVPIYEGVNELTVEDVKNYRNAYYRVQDIIIVLVGGIDFATGEALVRKHFGALEPSPERPARNIDPITEDKTVRWDLNVDVVYHVYPGPYKDFRERLMLTMFGAFLNSSFKNTEILVEIAVSTYSSNTIYPVRQIPFFIFGRPQPQSTPDRLSEFMDEQLHASIDMIDERLLASMKRITADFVTSTMISEDRHHHEMLRSNVIGQEGVNTGIRHLLREGRSNEEFIEIINSITLEEMKETLTRVCAPERKIEIRFVPSNR